MAESFDIHDLEQRLKEARQQYSAIKHTASDAVVCWEWTNGRRYDVRPFYFERDYKRLGKPILDQPASGNYYHYGLMADGSVAVEEAYKQGKLVEEIFWEYHSGFIETIRYVKQQPTFISKLTRINGLPYIYRGAEVYHGFNRYRVSFYEQEHYTHENAQLVRINIHKKNFTESWTTENICFYDDTGELERIEAHFPTSESGYIPIVYQRPIARSVKSDLVSDDVRQKLIDGIVDAIVQQHITQPVCAVVLNYVYLDGYFPPFIQLLLEADRQVNLAQGGDSLELLWMPPLERPFIEIKDQAARHLCENLLREVMGRELDDEAMNLLAVIAGDLMRVDWSNKLPITPDFIAYSVAWEMDNVIERIILSVPQDRLDLLRGQGFL